jgi:hypothetical protein
VRGALLIQNTIGATIHANPLMLAYMTRFVRQVFRGGEGI